MTANQTNATFVTTDANSDNTDKPVILPFEDIVDKYRNADKGGKARIRANLNKKAKAAMMDGSDELAKRLIVTEMALTAKTDKPVDFGQNVANVLFVAFGMIEAVRTYADENDVTVNWDNLDIPDIEDMMDGTDEMDFSGLSDTVDKTFNRLVSVKSDRRDIQGVYDRAFQNVAIGDALRISDICDKGALPDYSPGSGAVAARVQNRRNGQMVLKPTNPGEKDNCTLLGVIPAWVDKSGNVDFSDICPDSTIWVAGAQKTADRTNTDDSDESDNTDN